MKGWIHTAVLWLMLLATPLQGLAAAAMLGCDVSGPAMSSAPTPSIAIDHHAMHHVAAASSDDQRSHAGHRHCPQASGHVQGSDCAACCLGMALHPSSFAALVVPGHSSDSIPFLLAEPTAFVPETPQRPPQVFLV